MEIQLDLPKQKSNLDIQLDHLTVASRQELTELWLKQYKHPPPKGVKRGLLERAASYKIQSKRFGRLSARTHRALIALASGKVLEKTVPSNSPKPGTKLIRDWHGKTHQVEVLEEGFIWEGGIYKSLSATANAITGAKWSGPRFFGISK